MAKNTIREVIEVLIYLLPYIRALVYSSRSFVKYFNTL
jgi:hypothetical protein